MRDCRGDMIDAFKAGITRFRAKRLEIHAPDVGEFGSVVANIDHSASDTAYAGTGAPLENLGPERASADNRVEGAFDLQGDGIGRNALNEVGRTGEAGRVAEVICGRPFTELAQIVCRTVDATKRDEQISMRSAPSSPIRTNLRATGSKARLRCGSGSPSKSPNGWNRVISSK